MRPVIGRPFTVEEERPGSGLRSVIVSYRYWERTGFDRGILGHTSISTGKTTAWWAWRPKVRRHDGDHGGRVWLPLGVHDEIGNDSIRANIAG